MSDLTVDKLWDKLLVQPEISILCANKQVLNKVKTKLANYKYRVKEANPELGLDGFSLSFTSKELDDGAWQLHASLIEISPKVIDGIKLLEPDNDTD